MAHDAINFWLTLLCTAGEETTLVLFGASEQYAEHLRTLLEAQPLPCGHRVACTVEVGRGYRVTPGKDA